MLPITQDIVGVERLHVPPANWGKAIGIPPRMGFTPSNTELAETNRYSLPAQTAQWYGNHQQYPNYEHWVRRERGHINKEETRKQANARARARATLATKTTTNDAAELASEVLV